MNFSIPNRLLIGTEWVSTNQNVSIPDCFSGNLLAQAPLGEISHIEKAISVAHMAFSQTCKQPAYERASILQAIAAGIERRQKDFVELLITEAGKPISYAEIEVSRAVMTFMAAAEEARHQTGDLLDADAFPSGKNHFGWTRRFPIGVIAGITPFNFPLNLVAHKVAPCIATGNTMVLKPAMKTPFTALLLGEVLAGSGMIPGQINIITCPNSLVEKLLSDHRIKKLSFTGSVEVGWKLKHMCNKLRVTLELGGNAGVIVHEDAHLTQAIPAIASGGFAYAGQSCISVQRIFVHQPIYENFKTQLIEYVRNKIHTGDPRERETVVGPMIESASITRIQEWIQDAVNNGAKILHGGKVKGRCLEATILENVKRSLAICVEEAFAPIVILDSYQTFIEALKGINDSKFGLQAGVFTQDIHRAFNAFEELEVGGVLINQVPTFRVENMPYGGIKDSGFGREGIRYAMDEMTELKTVIFNLLKDKKTCS